LPHDPTNPDTSRDVILQRFSQPSRRSLGEMGVRGFVTAYDAETGKQVWRFYTVPGDPSQPFESKELEMAAKTWNGQWWKYGGGGTVWDAMAYDPELGLLYIGVGNGSPWNHQIRSNGEGDNLFLSSVVALKAETGEYVWHFQSTPAESWDFTATQHIILADLTIEGKKRKVLMQAPKNGFFYVVDRTNGEFIHAKNYVNVTWTTGLDPKTGRPEMIPEARFLKEPAMVSSGRNAVKCWVVVIPAEAGIHPILAVLTYSFASLSNKLSIVTPTAGTPPNTVPSLRSFKCPSAVCVADGGNGMKPTSLTYVADSPR
jgi:PQQ-dependent dehydrogenase (methanol/ethanol family)